MAATAPARTAWLIEVEVEVGVGVEVEAGIPACLREWASSHPHDVAFAPIGRGYGTWLVCFGNTRLVAKRMSAAQNPLEYTRLFGVLAHARLRPELVHVVDEPESPWYALFRFIPGDHPVPTPEGWQQLRPQLARLLRGLATISDPPGYDVLEHRSTTLADFAFPEPAARALRDRVFSHPPKTPPVLAHGDFAVQNMILTEGGAVLIDWSQSGRSPAGFDAGWILALSRAGVPLGCDDCSAATLTTGGPADPPAETLEWFADLGFLGLLWRTHTLHLEPFVRAAVQSRPVSVIEHALAAY